MPAAVECRDLRKTYDGKVEAVRGLSLAIQPGECFGLLGPNGAGKTTTIEILEGLLEATSGEKPLSYLPAFTPSHAAPMKFSARCS